MEIVKALNSIWKTLVKRWQKTRRLLVFLEALKNRVKDYKNEI